MLIGGPSFWFRDRRTARAAAGAARPPRRRRRDRRRRLHRPVDGVLPEARRPLAAHLRAGAGGCGWGASGRNGGWVVRRRRGLRRRALAAMRSRRWTRSAGSPRPRASRATSTRAARCRRHGAAQLARLRPSTAPGWLRAGRAGRAHPHRRRARRRVRPQLARVQPAALARGLADVVERMGVGVYEATRVTDRARRGADGARRCAGDWVVRATEGYTPHLGGVAPRALIPLRSTMIVTEPLPADVWAQIGWQGAELMHDAAPRTCTSRRRPTGASRSAGAAGPTTSGPARPLRRGRELALDRLADRLHELWPATRDVPIAHGWSGVFARSATGSRPWRPTRRPAWRGQAATSASASCAANLVGPHPRRPGAGRADRPRDAAVREPRAAARLGAGAAALHRRAPASTRCSAPPTATSARTGEPSKIGDLGNPDLRLGAPGARGRVRAPGQR